MYCVVCTITNWYRFLPFTRLELLRKAVVIRLDLFFSVDDVIDHYKHEQIVEGFTLQQAIPKTVNISRECRSDIYQTLSRATASDQLGSRAIINEPGVLKKGQLLKKGKTFSGLLSNGFTFSRKIT